MCDFQSNTLKTNDLDLKTSKLYESVSSDTWKIYAEEKDKVTQEMRRSGIYDLKNSLSGSQVFEAPENMVYASKILNSNVSEWHTLKEEDVKPLEKSTISQNYNVTLDAIKERYFSTGLDKSNILENSLHGFQHDMIKDDWLLLEGQDDKITYKKVVLENYNLNTSETESEKIALGYFTSLLKENKPDLDELSNNALVYGIPNEWRAITWQICLGYLPAEKEKRKDALLSKREAYLQLAKKYLPSNNKHYDIEVQHIIHVDVLRTHPTEFSNLFLNPTVQESLKRILFIWSCENRSIKYFQGLNDLCVAFFLTFLNSCFGPCSDFNKEYQTNKNINSYLKRFLPSIEADTYWCLAKVMSGLQNDVVFSEGGLHAERMVFNFKRLMTKIDKALVDRLDHLGIDFIMFSFRWMLCFMSRELTIKNTIILWDNYIARGPSGFHNFHLYVCAAFLNNLAPEIKNPNNDMTDCMFILQRPPSIYWEPKNVHQLIEQATELWSIYDL